MIPYPRDRPAVWNSAAVLITALATVAGTCVAGAALFVSMRSTDEDPAANPSPTSPPAATPASDRTASAGDGTAAATVLWQGRFLLDGTPGDFDSEPPRRGNTSTDLGIDAIVNGSPYQGLFGTRMESWRGSADPHRDACVALLDTHGQREVSIDARSRICLRTSSGWVAYLKVASRESDGYDANVTLWSSG